MKRGNMVICFLVVILLLSPLIFAIETQVKIKTIPGHEVQISATKNGQMLESFSNISDKYGDTSFNFNFNEPEYDLFVFIKKNNENIINPYKSPSSVTGELVYLELAPSGYNFIETPEAEPEINETEIETNETEIVTENKGESKISGMAVSVFSKVKESKSILIYVVIGVVVIGVVLLFIVRRKSGSREIKVTKLSDMMGSSKDSFDDVENKLKDAQEEIDRLRREMR